MCRRLLFLLVPVLGVSVSASAAAPVGIIRSSDTFELRGVPVKVAGVPSWPVVAGDEIATNASSAVISFRDGSRVTLDRKTKAKIEENGTFRLLQGTMWYTLTAGSTLRVASQSTLLQAAPGVEAKATTLKGLAASNSPGRSSPRPADLPPVSVWH